MIFVTVGTHEQQFNRLVEYIDKLKIDRVITDDVMIQTGYSTYEPKACQWSKFYPYQEMLEHVKKADVVITHGGPSSFIMPLQVGKVPIVVPRQLKFDEHVNDHQVNFCKAVEERQGNIIVIEDVEKLGRVITDYDKIISEMPSEMKSNNTNFCRSLNKIIDNLFK